MKRSAAFLVTSIGLLVSRPAGASPADPPAIAAAPADRFAFGARAGGYGFRNTQHAHHGTWDDCRMDGLGVFAQRTLGRHLFAELGFDLYTAKDATPTEEMPAPMDRISGITTIAGGARIPWRWISPYVQIGVGLEVTRVEMPQHGQTDRAVVPMGFLGFGAELRATERVSLGAAVRTNLLKHYEHGGDHLHAEDASAPADDAMRSEYEAAAQGQLFVRFEL